jgi:hypothetical protein
MLGSLRMTIKDAMKELHALGSKLRLGEADTQLPPTERLNLLKNQIREMMTNNYVPEDAGLQDKRFSGSRCKV